MCEFNSKITIAQLLRMTFVSAKSTIYSPRRSYLSPGNSIVLEIVATLLFISVTIFWWFWGSFCWNSSTLPTDLFIFVTYALLAVQTKHTIRVTKHIQLNKFLTVHIKPFLERTLTVNNIAQKRQQTFIQIIFHCHISNFFLPLQSWVQNKCKLPDFDATSVNTVMHSRRSIPSMFVKSIKNCHLISVLYIIPS